MQMYLYITLPINYSLSDNPLQRVHLILKNYLLLVICILVLVDQVSRSFRFLILFHESSRLEHTRKRKGKGEKKEP